MRWMQSQDMDVRFFAGWETTENLPCFERLVSKMKASGKPSFYGFDGEVVGNFDERIKSKENRSRTRTEVDASRQCIFRQLQCFAASDVIERTFSLA